MVLGGGDHTTLILSAVLITLVLVLLYLLFPARMQKVMDFLKLGSVGPCKAKCPSAFVSWDQTATMGGGVSDQVGLHSMGTVMKKVCSNKSAVYDGDFYSHQSGDTTSADTSYKSYTLQDHNDTSATTDPVKSKASLRQGLRRSKLTVASTDAALAGTMHM